MAHLVGTTIKQEYQDDTKVKVQKIKEEPKVNTCRKDKSWPKNAKLVHVDGTLCSDIFIKNEHYSKYVEKDMPTENVTRAKNVVVKQQIESPTGKLLCVTEHNNGATGHGNRKTVTPSSPEGVLSKSKTVTTGSNKDTTTNDPADTPNLVTTDKQDLPELQSN